MSSKIFLKMPVKKFRFCKILGSKTENKQNNKFVTLPLNYCKSGDGPIPFFRKNIPVSINCSAPNHVI